MKFTEMVKFLTEENYQLISESFEWKKFQTGGKYSVKFAGIPKVFEVDKAMKNDEGNMELTIKSKSAFEDVLKKGAKVEMTPIYQYSGKSSTLNEFNVTLKDVVADKGTIVLTYKG